MRTLGALIDISVSIEFHCGPIVMCAKGGERALPAWMPCYDGVVGQVEDNGSELFRNNILLHRMAFGRPVPAENPIRRQRKL